MDRLMTIWPAVCGHGVERSLPCAASFRDPPSGGAHYWAVRAAGMRSWTLTPKRCRHAAEAVESIAGLDVPLSTAVTIQPSQVVRGIERMADRCEAVPCGPSRAVASEIATALTTQTDWFIGIIRTADKLVDAMPSMSNKPFTYAKDVRKLWRLRSALKGVVVDIGATVAAWALSAPSPSSFSTARRERNEFVRELVVAIRAAIRNVGTLHCDTMVVKPGNSLSWIWATSKALAAIYDGQLGYFLHWLESEPSSHAERLAFAALVASKAVRTVEHADRQHLIVANELADFAAGAVTYAVMRHRQISVAR